MKIDAHHHLWRYDPVDYRWIDESMKIVQRDFTPDELRSVLAAAGIDGAISVQARQSKMETTWLLEMASQCDFIKGVVGWVDLASANVRSDLEHFAGNLKLRAIRHVVQSETNGFLLRSDFNRGIRELKKFGLAYDILIFERQLPETIQFVDDHPEQVFVLDHLAKPGIKEGSFKSWSQLISKLAERPNVFCKISGMVTEADWAHWTDTQLRPYFNRALDVFGPKRLMFGSDWPVCLIACEYRRWYQLVSEWVVDLTFDEQACILGGTAIHAYGLAPR